MYLIKFSFISIRPICTEHAKDSIPQLAEEGEQELPIPKQGIMHGNMTLYHSWLKSRTAMHEQPRQKTLRQKTLSTLHTNNSSDRKLS